MYRVTIYNDGAATVIHEPSVDPTDPHLYSCQLTQGCSGEIDTLQFTILPNNPGYELLNSRLTLIEVLNTKTGEIEFSGRVLTMTPEMEDNGLIYKTIVCEDRLGYLCDSIQPYLAKETYWGNDEQTGLEQYLTLVLDNHNSQVEDYKKIYLGNVTFATSTDNVTKGLTYESTWSTISSKLLNDLGGEMQLREGEDGLLYLDYVDELGEKKDSPVIEFARNMRSISCEIDPTEVITRLIPLGASLGSTTTTTESAEATSTSTEDGDYLTIADVNDGVIYLDDVDAQEIYGIVEGTVQWQDVTQADNLLTKAKSWLASQSFTDSVTISALDLSLIGLDDESIERYNYYRVINTAIGLDDYLRVIKKTTNICDPSDITYELGGRKHTLSGTLNNATTSADNATKALLTTSTTFALKEAAIYTEIENSVATIKSDIAGEYVQISTQTDDDGNVVAEYYTTGDIYNAILQIVGQSENSILLEVSGTYATTGSVTEAIETAEGYTDSKLTNYTTTSDMTSAIETAVSNESASILQTVSGTYATIGSVTEAIETAEGYTDTKLTNYSTTTEVEAAIETAVSEESASIQSEISKTYVQISTVTDEDGNPVYDEDGNEIAGYTTTAEIYNAITQMITESENSIKLYVSETVGEEETVSSMLVLEIATDESGTKYGKLSANVDYIELDTGDLIINSSQFTLDADGNATFSGTLNAASGSFSGDIYATSGYFSGTLAADIVTASNIQDAAVTNAAIAAAAVTNSSIATGAVTYDKISVSTLSAISADVGTLTAGVIQSSNYVSGSAGVYIDLTNGTAEFSGDVRATSFSLGDAKFSITSETYSQTVISASGTTGTSSIVLLYYLTLTTDYSNGFKADAISTTYFGATTAYADGLHAKYIYASNDLYAEYITARSTLYADSIVNYGSLTQTGSITVSGTAKFNSTVTCGSTLDVTGATTLNSILYVGGNANMYSNAAVWGNLTVVGYVEATSFNESDKRLKTDLESLEVYDTFFDNLQTGRFKYTFDDSGKYHNGMYAQDVEESLLACGLTTDDFAGLMKISKDESCATYRGLNEEYGLNYTEFIPILIYQVQQEKKRTATLESTVEVLQAQIEAIYEVMQASA